MSYDIAINKAWDELVNLNAGKNLIVNFLADEYCVNSVQKKVLSLSCNVPAKDFTAILILHYLIQQLKGLPGQAGEWETFRELSGVEGYGEAFRKRAIEPVIRKYGSNPQGIWQALGRFKAEKAADTEIGIILQAFKEVPVLIKLWSADQEFGPDANIYFDKSITKIFCTEDIVVLAGIIASQL